jgi:hypothetical protein
LTPAELGGLGNYTQGAPAPQMGTFVPTLAGPVYEVPITQSPAATPVYFYIPEIADPGFVRYDAGGFDQFTEGAYLVGKGGSGGV